MVQQLTLDKRQDKLYGQFEGRLVDVRLSSTDELPLIFWKYDQSISGVHPESKKDLQISAEPHTPLIVLTLIGNYGIPFTVVKAYTPEKLSRYDMLREKILYLRG